MVFPLKRFEVVDFGLYGGALGVIAHGSFGIEEGKIINSAQDEINMNTPKVAEECFMLKSNGQIVKCTPVPH